MKVLTKNGKPILVDGKMITVDEVTQISDVTINGKSIVVDGVAEMPLASYNKIGVLGFVDGGGMAMHTNGMVYSPAYTKEIYKTRNNETFIGKGTLENIKEDYVTSVIDIKPGESIKKQILEPSDLKHYVKDTDYATAAKAGVVAAFVDWPGFGIMQNGDHILYVTKASEEQINAKENPYQPIVPSNLEYAVNSVLYKPWNTLFREDVTFDEEGTLEISLPNVIRFNLYISADSESSVGNYGQIQAFDENGKDMGYISELGNKGSSTEAKVASVYFGVIIGGKWAQKKWDSPGNVGPIISGNGPEYGFSKGNITFKNPHKVSKLKMPKLKGTFHIGIYGY